MRTSVMLNNGAADPGIAFSPSASMTASMQLKAEHTPPEALGALRPVGMLDAIRDVMKAVSEVIVNNVQSRTFNASSLALTLAFES